MGVKYCGGCTARYDRVAFVDGVRAVMPPYVELVRHDEERAQIILLVAGCSTACPDITAFDGKRVVTADGRTGVEETVSALLDAIGRVER